MKVIFLDIDGTLIPCGKAMPPESAIKAVEMARKNGHRVYLNTGRCRAEVPKELVQIGFDGIICSNSLYIEDDGKVCQQKDIPPADVKRISDWLLQNQIGFFFEGHKSVAAVRLYFEQMGAKFGEKVLHDLEKSFPCIKEAELDYNCIAKINYVLHPGVIEKIRAEFGDEFQINQWSLLGSDKGMGDITRKDASKASGVHFIAEKLGVKVEDTFAFGDTAGDLPMLKVCGTGVAMGNSEPGLKEGADYITGNVDENGIFDAFQHFGLI